MELEEVAVVEAVAEEAAAVERVEVKRQAAQKRREVGLDGGFGLRARVEGGGGRGREEGAEGGAREEGEEPGPARAGVGVGEGRRGELRGERGGVDGREVERVDDGGEVALREGAREGVEGGIGGRGGQRGRRRVEEGGLGRRRERTRRRWLQRGSDGRRVEATVEGDDLAEEIIDAVFHVVGHRGRRVQLRVKKANQRHVAADVLRDENGGRVAVDSAQEVHTIVGSFHAEGLQTRQSLLRSQIDIGDLRLDLQVIRFVLSHGNRPGERPSVRSRTQQQSH